MPFSIFVRVLWQRKNGVSPRDMSTIKKENYNTPVGEPLKKMTVRHITMIKNELSMICTKSKVYPPSDRKLKGTLQRRRIRGREQAQELQRL